MDITGDANVKNIISTFKKLIYVHGRVKGCYYEALKMCPGHPEEEGIKSCERNIGPFHKPWNAFELDCQKIL